LILQLIFNLDMLIYKNIRNYIKNVKIIIKKKKNIYNLIEIELD